MTIPKSKILSSSRSILTKATVASDVNKNQNIQNVNVVVRSLSEEKSVPENQPPQISPVTSTGNIPTYPYPELPAATSFGIQPAASYTDRSPEEILSQYENQLQNSQSINQALSLVIDILESNPLIINKYIISSFVNLQKLILLLTSADQVELELDDPDIDCFCSAITDYQRIKSIYILKNNQQYNFHYAFPESVRILERHKISTHIVQLTDEPSQPAAVSYN